MEDKFDPKKEVKNFRFNNKDEKNLKFPSIHYLERYADLILKLIDKVQSMDDHMITPFLSIKLDVEIFKEDLVGSLSHDYCKRNLRYTDNWKTENYKIECLSNEFIREFENYKR